MLGTIGDAISDALGLALEAKDLSAGQMSLRAFVVFLIVLLLIRALDRRFLGKSAPFDVILAMLLGSMASRAITGNAPFVPTMTAVVVLVLLHRILASLAFRSHWFGSIVKGGARPLVREGKFVEETMRKAHFTHDDIMEALRLSARTEKVEDVKVAYIERSGDVSVIKKDGA